MQLKCHIITLGCQKNEYDSQVIEGLLSSIGYTKSEDIENSDLIVLNTCCVRDKADVKVYGRLGQYYELKKQNPNLIIIVTGCLAQKDGKKILSRFKSVNLVIGTRNLKYLPQLVEETSRTGKRRYVCDMKDMEFENLPTARGNEKSAWIPISEGCDCHCTYCIVPFVRGPMTSRNPENIISEIKEFAGKGGLEVTLLGQNVNAYGKDNPDYGSFESLLKKINQIECIKRIRFISPHPANFGENCIKTISELKKVCKAIHLPLQAGDDLILRRMGRNYTTETYRNIVKMLRHYIPDVSITTDIIVGFPGETLQQFQNTLDFVKEMQFDGAFMFAYSEREGTAAVKMKDPIERSEKMKRLNTLIKEQNDITYKKHVFREGTFEEVLAERVSKKNSDFITGYTSRKDVVNFQANENVIGKLVNIKLLKGFTWGFIGELSNDKTTQNKSEKQFNRRTHSLSVFI